jgi:hypothetical protein
VARATRCPEPSLHVEPGLFNLADPDDEASAEKAIAALGWRAHFRMEPA